MIQHHEPRNKYNGRDSYRKSFLLILTFLMTWICTYRMLSKLRQFDVTDERLPEDSLNGTTDIPMNYKKLPFQYATTETKFIANEKRSYSSSLDVVQHGDEKRIDELVVEDDHMEDDDEG